MEQNLDRAEAIIDAYGCDQSNLIAIMQEIQGEYKYLSEGALTLIAEKLGISTAKVYSVATFYENFSLEAKGRHIIKVCTGTACHVRKSGPIYDSLRDALGLTGKRKTSADGLFTLETVACLGACGLAPVMTIDGEVHAKMTPEDALALAGDEENVWLIGGGSIYTALLGRCRRASVTRVDSTVSDADTFFPDLDALPNWKIERTGEAVTENGLTYRFVDYVNTALL